MKDIASGATICGKVEIGECSWIGAGAMIIRDNPDNATVVGNPGRIINSNKL